MPQPPPAIIFFTHHHNTLIISSSPHFSPALLLRLVTVSRQLRASITPSVVAQALHQHVPKVPWGQIADRPMAFYIDVVRSYFAPCADDEDTVLAMVERYATENHTRLFDEEVAAMGRPAVQAHLFIRCSLLFRTLLTRGGREMMIQALERHDKKNEAVPGFIDTALHILRTEYAVTRRRVVAGTAGIDIGGGPPSWMKEELLEED